MFKLKFKYDKKMALKVAENEYLFVRIEEQQPKRIAKGKVLVSCMRTEEKFRVMESELITLEEYASIKASAAAAPQPAPIDLANPQEFADALAKLESAEAIKELCYQLCNCKSIFKNGFENYEPKTRSTYLSGYSKVVEKIPTTETNSFIQVRKNGDSWTRHLYFKYTGIADTNWQEINKKAKARVLSNLNAQLGIDLEKYERSILDLLKSKNIWEVAAGLLASVGRRPVEIFYKGIFALKLVEGEYKLVFDGQAKKRQKEHGPYYIPVVGCTPELFIEKLNLLRASPEILKLRNNITPKQIENGKEADAFSAQIRRLGILPKLSWIPTPDGTSPTCSDLRSTWLVCAEARFKKDSQYSLAFRVAALGHEDDFIGNTPVFNYSRYAVEPKSDFVADLREVEATVEKWEKEEVATEQITAISLHQPWASLIASGHKCFETRSWPTKYRGPIAIHAAKKIEEDPRLLKLLGIPASKVPRGAIVAIADLADCVQMDAAFIAAQSDTERMCGDWSVGRWAWRLENVRTIEPVAARGMQGLWQWEMPPFLEVVDHKFVPVVATAIKLVKIDSSPAITADISGRHEEVRAKLEKECPIENVDATAPSKNIDAIIPQIASRHEFDFYETPPWLSLLTLANVPLSGTIGECCVGHGAIASILQMANFKIWTNDIDPAKQADYHSDATLPESWEHLPPADWIVTNPPYAEMSAPIVKNAYAHTAKGIVMILRQNWIEGCDDRRDFLKAHPPTLAISVPRYCYRKGKNGTWATDQCPTWIYIWDKSNRSGLTKIITLGAEDIPLFHRTPEGIPSVELIEVEVQRIMGGKPVEESDRITQTMLQFMEQNAGDRRVYVGQTVVAKLCKIGNNKANTWIKENRELLAKHNKGLNPFVTR